MSGGKFRHAQVRIPEEIANTFDEFFDHGQKQAFLLSCIENLVRIVKEGELPPPSEYSRRATLGAISDMAKVG